MQLRREASVSYRPLRRRLAAYGFAALVIGGATLDATVFAPEPRESRVAAPVELEPAATAVTVEVDPPAAGTMLALPNVTWLDGARARNAIDLDGVRYKIYHPSSLDGIDVELRVGHGHERCALHVQDEDGVIATHGALPAVGARFQDGEYRLWVECDGARTEVTTLLVSVSKLAR